MKKAFLIGAIFGAVIVPLSSLGLAILAAEIFLKPFVIVSVAVINALMDTSKTNGLISIGSLMLLNALLYGLIGMLYHTLKVRWNKRVAVGMLIAGYIVVFFLANPAFLHVGA